MPKRLVFVTLAGQGHVTPSLPLVEELVRRRHRVDYATGSEYADAVVGAGARWVPLPSLKPFSAPARVSSETILSWLQHYFAAMSATYPVLYEHCSATRPDAVCYDTTNWPGRLVAEKLGIPPVRCIPNLASNEAFSLDDDLMGGIDADHPVMVALAAECARFSDEHGVHLDFAGTMDVVEALNLVFVPREFQPAGETFDDRFRFVGPLLGQRERKEPWTPRVPDLPVLFVSLGSVFTDAAFYRTCLEAFRDGAWQVAMTVRDVDPASLGPIPSTVDIRPWFPQPAVLGHASAFVSHAGMNSTMEALCFRVPIVAFPHTPEQVINANRVQELGLGERLDSATPSPEELRAVVTRVASSGAVRANLDRMQDAIRRSGGAVRGADEIEQYLGLGTTTG
ncbi:glycosyltransferase, MGT family [Streptoalloteichus tenebrarius]|uniref:Glycosyltransferase, MGT family n=1 Tax=Streptoalloteichus tenebrarius (strain ATCC 17920 / DSM 40477 / JCM 4838 / CBS 697.72 / NBRC 16177 / NCIMB 11028 / NRRL B-12390 / A12253. 1 / ISP 5477) TaxID=1933 RepID=A0ABT1HUU7_STRSD|nr:macrolide family glycosyltransferase [Streptoalloteichus tenebrarius]MCP2259292.1 glycosyltransferase, MGT family [Streptoalloteichus tenebrarius]BFE99053.1 glycosyltransferase [Streptoalloteichus tenebrarius]